MGATEKQLFFVNLLDTSITAEHKELRRKQENKTSLLRCFRVMAAPGQEEKQIK